MRNKSLVLLLVLALFFVGLASCSGDFISFNDPGLKRQESISNFISDDVTGKTGETYKTKWFEFAIQSIEKVDSYASHKAKEGYQLYKVSITEKSVWDSSISMGIFDFYMDDTDFAEYIWAIPPLDDTMMPEDFHLQPNETVQYVMIFEVPANTTNLALMYTENDESGDLGVTFSISID